MARSDNLYSLPDDLPIPKDDGACNHLTGLLLPNLPLPATTNVWIDLSQLEGRTVVYAYPRTGEPDRDPPDGWDLIPGARGCTPQSCSFRDHYQELQVLNVGVFGMSTQDTPYQQEAATRLHLPFPLLSDHNLQFANALNLPTFTVEGMTLLKRVTLILNNGEIEKVFYPVFPPDQSANVVIAWLEANPAK
jgi:peroxiredoxin